MGVDLGLNGLPSTVEYVHAFFDGGPIEWKSFDAALESVGGEKVEEEGCEVVELEIVVVGGVFGGVEYLGEVVGPEGEGGGCWLG